MVVAWTKHLEGTQALAGTRKRTELKLLKGRGPATPEPITTLLKPRVPRVAVDSARSQPKHRTTALAQESSVIPRAPEGKRVARPAPLKTNYGPKDKLRVAQLKILRQYPSIQLYRDQFRARLKKILDVSECKFTDMTSASDKARRSKNEKLGAPLSALEVKQGIAQAHCRDIERARKSSAESFNAGTRDASCAVCGWYEGCAIEHASCSDLYDEAYEEPASPTDRVQKRGLPFGRWSTLAQ